MKCSLFLLILFLWNSMLPAPQEGSLSENEEKAVPVPLDFDEEKVASFKEDPSFDYSQKIQEENWWTSFKRYISMQWEKLMNWLLGDFEAPIAVAFFLEMLPYILLLLLLSFITYLFIRLYPAVSPLSSGKNPELILDEDEKIIRFKDIPDLIKKALSRGNYRLAVRYQFLYVLQQLADRDIVEYDSSKTDEEYLSEIQDPSVKKQFQKLNRIYDFVWYGNFSTNLQNYERIERDFERMQSMISE